MFQPLMNSESGLSDPVYVASLKNCNDLEVRQDVAAKLQTSEEQTITLTRK